MESIDSIDSTRPNQNVTLHTTYNLHIYTHTCRGRSATWRGRRTGAGASGSSAPRAPARRSATSTSMCVGGCVDVGTCVCIPILRAYVSLQVDLIRALLYISTPSLYTNTTERRTSSASTCSSRPSRRSARKVRTKLKTQHRTMSTHPPDPPPNTHTPLYTHTGTFDLVCEADGSACTAHEAVLDAYFSGILYDECALGECAPATAGNQTLQESMCVATALRVGGVLGSSG